MNQRRSLVTSMSASALLALGSVVAVAALGQAAEESPTFFISPAEGTIAGGTEVSVTPPVGVTFTSVSAGDMHSLAVGSDGNAYAWGYNNVGQLGDGQATDAHSVPVRVALPAGVVVESVAAGGYHSLALTSDGSAYAWGSATYGQLGDGVPTWARAVPVEVTLPDDVTFTSVSAGIDHSLALGSDGNAYTWGSNSQGQLGDGGTDAQWTPVKVTLPEGVTFESVSAGRYHALAVGSNGRAYAWGDDAHGQLGDGGPIADQPTPVEVLLSADVTVKSVSAGGFHSLALGSDGRAYAWGSNDFGFLGNGESGTAQLVPVDVIHPGDVLFESVAAGGYHSSAVGLDGKAYSWGSGGYGQLGAGGPGANQLEPVEVASPGDVTFESVSLGNFHSLGVGSDGKTFAWGYNIVGQLGDGGSNTDQSVPVEVSLPQVAVTAVSFGGDSGTDLAQDGEVWSVITPEHSAGAVDVVLEWMLDGIEQPALTLADGFTYVSAPSAPTDVMGVAGDQEVSLSWTAPTDDGGKPVTDYVIEFSADAGLTWSVFADGTSAATTARVTGLTNGAGYVFRVAAVNAVGQGPFSAPSERVALLPSAPVGVVVSGGLLQAHVGWDLSTANAGAGLVEYTVSVAQAGDVLTCTTTQAFCVITGLAAGEVTASVVAQNADGASPPTVASGTVLSLDEVPATAPADQGGATVEFLNQAGEPVTEVEPGDELTAVVDGFAPSSRVDVFVYSTPQHLGSALTDAQGNATFSVTLPADLELGSHTLVALGLTSSGDTATAAVSVEASDIGSETPEPGDTGPETPEPGDSPGVTPDDTTDNAADDDADEAPALAATGADGAMPALIAGLLLTLGFVVVTRTRNRQQA